MLNIHTLGLFCGFVGGLLSIEAIVYLRTSTDALARMEQRMERGYGVYAPSRKEIEREFKEVYVPRVRRRKYVDAFGFLLIAAGFLLELE
jgi:hypothetical protein